MESRLDKLLSNAKKGLCTQCGIPLECGLDTFVRSDGYGKDPNKCALLSYEVSHRFFSLFSVAIVFAIQGESAAYFTKNTGATTASDDTPPPRWRSLTNCKVVCVALFWTLKGTMQTTFSTTACPRDWADAAA